MNLRLLLILLVFPAMGYTQFLPPQTTLSEALSKAAAANRLIFLMIESGDCRQCNEVAGKAMASDSLQEYLKQHFVVLRIAPFHADMEFIEEKYNYYGGNAVLFIDSNGILVHKMNVSTSDYKRYRRECSIAIGNRAEADKIRLSERPPSSEQDLTTFYASLLKLNELGLPTVSYIDMYVSRLPSDSLLSPYTIQQIARLSPILGSKADVAMRRNSSLFSQAWFGIPNKERVVINKQIIFKTRKMAVAQKQYSLAVRVAEFARMIHINEQEGNKAYRLNIMKYYRAIKDTAAYIKEARKYYDEFYMSVNAAEIKNKDSIRTAELLARLPINDTIKRSGNQFSVRTGVTASSEARELSEDLSRGARSFYSMTKNNSLLKKALEWMEHAAELYESPYTLDTWARLEYKVNNNAAKAIQLEEKAIAAAKGRGYATEEFTAVLNKMKQGVVEIDL